MNVPANFYLSTEAQASKELAAGAEKKIRECHEVVTSIKAAEANGIDTDKLFALQVSLARALYAMERKMLELKNESKAITTELRSGKTEAQIDRLKNLKVQVGALERMIDYGKMVGDSFAWLFYQKEEELLRRHHAHQRIDHSPVGVGGIGEIEFVANFQKINGRFVLLHSTTTFLRIGDFSVVNLETGGVEGLGEIKTSKEGAGGLTAQVSIVGKEGAIAVPVVPGVPVGNLPPPEPSPPAIAARLERQVKKMREAYRPKTPASSEKQVLLPHTQLVFNPFPLEKLYDASTLERGNVMALSAGVFLAGIKSPADSLTNHLFAERPSDATAALAHIATELHPLVLAGSSDNSIKIGFLIYYSRDRYNLDFGRTPPMWWPIRQQVIDALFRHEFIVATFFNPAFLIARFRERGYVIEYISPGRGHMLRAMQPNGVEAIFASLDYFFDLAARHLVTEDSIFGAVVSIVEGVRAQNLPTGARVSLSLSFRDDR